jgi:transcriptional regulator with XRE-family HTH domain
LQIVDQIREKLQSKGLSVLKMSNQTGISAYKIYKWLDGKGKPKHEDVVKIGKWLGNNIEEVPSAELQESNGQPDDLPTLLSQLMQKQNQLMEMQNKILAEQKEDIIDKVKEVHINSKSTIAYLQTILRAVRADDAVMMDIVKSEVQPYKRATLKWPQQCIRTERTRR